MTPLTTRSFAHVAIVGAGPGDPELLTLKAYRLLEQAHVVLFDHLVSPDILAVCSERARMIDVGKIPGGKATSQEVINALLIKEAAGEGLVVRLKGGDPFLFGRGGEEALALEQAQVPYEVVPGVSSSLSAPMSAGIPVTHRKVSRHVSIITGMSAAGDQQELIDQWGALARASGTLVFMMGVGRAPLIVQTLLAAGLSPSTPAAFVQEGTRPSQRVVEATLATLIEARDAHHVRSPSVLVVGDVVGLRQRIAGGMLAPLGEAVVHAAPQQDPTHSSTEAVG